MRVCKLPNWYMSWYNSQKLHKIRYQSFLGHVNYIRCLCFVPNTLSKIVGLRFILGLKVILDPRVGVLWTPLGFQSSKCVDLSRFLFCPRILSLPRLLCPKILDALKILGRAFLVCFPNALFLLSNNHRDIENLLCS